jgi:hypothetical protein
MVNGYIADYFLFVFFASFGVLQIALSKKLSGRTLFGALLVVLSYLWFFTARNRNVHTVLEGSQLSFIFILSAALAVIVTRFLNLAKGKR